LLPCGEALLHQLYADANTLLGTHPLQSNDFAALKDTARRKMKTSSGPALAGWIRLYADASILNCLTSVDASTAPQAIAELDQVLIFCGSASGRFDLVQAIIADIQLTYLSPWPTDFTTRSPYKACQGDNIDIPLVNSRQTIPSLPTPPSLHVFQGRYLDYPFILRGHAREWPALTDHPWSSAAYLRAMSGPGRVVPVEVGLDYREENWTQKIIFWDAFLAQLELDDQPHPPKASEILYLAQHDLLAQFPALRQDIIIPDYVYADIPLARHPHYQPPSNDERLVINAWLGPKNTISPAHVVSVPRYVAILTLSH
jgi:hypothetical protein